MSVWEFKDKARPRGSFAVETEDREVQVEGRSQTCPNWIFSCAATR
jgi:hypothetical protein